MTESAASAEYQVALPDFEGPLDLLLHLVKRHELDILEIPIAFITEKYLEYLELMRALNLDVAGEYLLMAATLAHIKSRELLPQKDPLADDATDADDDERDPRAELIRRLLEYQRYRDAAGQLGDRPTLGRQVFGRGAPVEVDGTGEVRLREVGTFALLEALSAVLSRAKVKLTYDVVIDRISITDRINGIVDRLASSATVRFVDCFAFSDGEARSIAQIRHDLVVTFLAVLEMARLQMVRILQHETDGEIYLTRTSDLAVVAAEPLQSLDGGYG